jgi:hypothetical protein
MLVSNKAGMPKEEPEMTEPIDRREHQRLDVELRVRLEHSGRELQATAVNLSEQGMRLLTPGPTGAVRGDEVLVELRLRDGAAPVKALGWVAQVDSSEPGEALSLTIFGLPEGDARRIRAFVTAGLAV